MKALLIALFGILFWSEQGFSRTAPPFRGELLSGGRVSLAQYLKPHRALFLSFWASWCGPCIEELKLVTAKLRSDPSIPLDILTVNVDTSETSSDVRPAMKLHHLDVPIVLDPKRDIFSKFQQSTSLPFSVLVSADGTIEATFNGYHEEMFNKVKEVLSNRLSHVVAKQN